MPRKANPALLKPMNISPTLAAVVGPGPFPRGQVMKKVWEYIKANGLQDAQNKRMINADDNLRLLFNGQDQVSMFEMTKLISTHLS